MSHAGDPEVHRITTAAPGLTADQITRRRRYLISMTIRTLCFLGAVVTPPPWRWGLVVAAVLLPYIAVVMANARRDEPPASGLEVFTREERPAIDGDKH
ncbi:MAG TPA: DUF3099 domain-containing protein [Candidatus Nanopelagicales bacterium]|jgi:Flp pilus assembly protein TadB